MPKESKVPYVAATGRITTALERLQAASTPPRFTQDFLATKLGVKGGSGAPVLPFLKRTGFLGSDGVPTELYKRFRNPAQRGAAAAEALKIGYEPLYEINEYVHEAKDAELKGIVIQATGLDEGSRAVAAITGSFKALLAFADFEALESGAAAAAEAPETSRTPEAPGSSAKGAHQGVPGGVNLGYTINLQLPATSDIAVFDAIFQSLREHLIAD